MGSLKKRIDDYAHRIARETAAEMETHLSDQLRSDMQELARMLRQQGDAADEVAEVFGRTLARLTAEVERLQARLDAVSAGQA